MIDFPNSPANGDVFTSGNSSWAWNAATSQWRTALTPNAVLDNTVTTTKIVDANVTAPKLASGAAISNIGYTPVNKAGDTMSGPLGVGVFTHGSNSGEARLGRADDRYVGVATLQLGGTSAQIFEIVDKGWSNILFSVADGGAINMPVQPLWSGYNASSSASSWGIVKPFGTRHNKGSYTLDATNGRFTAQVAGSYVIIWSGHTHNSYTDYLGIQKNGGNLFLSYVNNGHAWNNFEMSTTTYLNAGDYIEFYIFGGTGTYTVDNGVWSSMSIIMLG